MGDQCRIIFLKNPLFSKYPWNQQKNTVYLTYLDDEKNCNTGEERCARIYLRAEIEEELMKNNIMDAHGSEDGKEDLYDY